MRTLVLALLLALAACSGTRAHTDGEHGTLLHFSGAPAVWAANPAALTSPTAASTPAAKTNRRPIAHLPCLVCRTECTGPAPSRFLDRTDELGPSPSTTPEPAIGTLESGRLGLSGVVAEGDTDAGPEISCG